MQVTADWPAHPLWPLCLNSLNKPAQIAGWLVHIRFANLDKTQPDNRIHLDLPAISLFSDKLVMHLAFGRYVNHHIGT
jgi:hypothetical protein